ERDPAREPDHGQGDPGLPRAHRLRRRLQAGRRPAHRQGRARLDDPRARGAGPSLARARPPAVRGQLAARRHRAPARAPRHGALLRLPPPPARVRQGAVRMTVREIFETLDYGPAPEAADLALAWLDRHGRRFGHFIGGRFTAPGETFPTHHPGDASELAHVTQGTAEDVDAAVKAARAALPRWQALGGHGRARYLYALARHVQKHARLLAVLESLDNGKPIRETRDIDVPLVARHLYHHAGWAQLLEKE